MNAATIKTLLEINNNLPIELIERLSEPSVSQRNGDALLSKPLESIKEYITNVRLKNGQVVIETNLFYDSNSTSSKIKPLHKGGGNGIFCLDMTCKY